MERLLLLLIFLLPAVHARADLLFWKPQGQNAYYVLPAQISPHDYLASTQNESALKNFNQTMRFSNSDVIKVLKTDSLGDSTHTLLLANNFNDHTVHHERINTFADHFNETYVLPVGAALKLQPHKRAQFYRDLAKHFTLLIAMGGDDVDTSLYQEKRTWARGTNRLRDELEAEVIRYFYFNSNRKIFGVCRGAQLTSVVLGAKLIQDNKEDLKITEDHLDGAIHDTKLLPTRHNIYAEIVQSVGTLQVNSYHHESLNASSLNKTPLQISAISPEGIVEAAESLDNRVLLTQHHPEKTHIQTDYQNRFFKALKAWAKMNSNSSCRSLL